MNGLSRYIILGIWVGMHLWSIQLIAQKLPVSLDPYISSIDFSSVEGEIPTINTQKMDSNLYRIEVIWDIKKDLSLKNISLNIFPDFKPKYHWAPHLTPTDNHIIAQHVFRSPALIVSNSEYYLGIVPDLSLLERKPEIPWFLDLDAVNNKLSIGFSKSKITEHVLYEKEDITLFSKGIYRLAFYVMISRSEEDFENPFARVNSFMWKNWGSKLYQKGEPIRNNNLNPYIENTYDWAFKYWRDAVWQQFEINGKEVGAPTFIVNVTQSPNYPAEINEREFRSIWNQAWFNSFRSASGLYRFARRKNIDSLKRYAEMTKELALAFPQKNGFFPGLIATEMVDVQVDGKKYRRSAGWDTKYFGNSNRNPFTWDAKHAPYHVLDMSYTGLLMLDWYSELEKDQRLLDYVKNYADALVKIQRKDGYFPAWLDLNNQTDMEVLSKSPESALSVTFLLRLFQITKNEQYKIAALKALQVIEEEIIPEGKWEDFETYWSCSRFGHDSLVGQKVKRNNMYKQNTLSIFYTAQAEMEAFRLTGNRHHLKVGQRVLDELLMWQSVWQPSFIYIHALGGFGVMNADAEWNDSRQSLFAELIMEYGLKLNRKDYFERGIAALKASFVMMYTPENKETKEQWQQRWPFLGIEDYGFMMENYGHDGFTDSNGIGIGEFSIYDWGNGAAAEAYNRIIDHWGETVLSKR